MSKSLGFEYSKAPYRYVAKYKDGKWGEGYLSTDENIVLNECANIFHYTQECFEGLKAHTTKDGRIVCFRPDMNAKRMANSCRRLSMPVYPEDKFIEGVKQVIAANKELVPPHGDGSSLYVRPFMIGTDPILGVKPANEFEFRIFVCPVGPYFKGGDQTVRIRVCDLDRAAPRGTGNVKAGLNYAMSLFAITEAHELGYAENLYLDPASRTYIEETGGANIFFVTKEGSIVTPKSDSILPSITKNSLMRIAEDRLGIKTEERPVRLDEIGDYVECGLCGTAAVISPVDTIDDHGKEYHFFKEGYSRDSVCGRLRQLLVDIQLGDAEDKDGWVCYID